MSEQNKNQNWKGESAPLPGSWGVPLWSCEACANLLTCPLMYPGVQSSCHGGLCQRVEVRSVAASWREGPGVAGLTFQMRLP